MLTSVGFTASSGEKASKKVYQVESHNDTDDIADDDSGQHDLEQRIPMMSISSNAVGVQSVVEQQQKADRAATGSAGSLGLTTAVIGATMLVTS